MSKKTSVKDNPKKKETKIVKCTAKDVGHSACKCGGQHCGDNVTS